MSKGMRVARAKCAFCGRGGPQPDMICADCRPWTVRGRGPVVCAAYCCDRLAMLDGSGMPLVGLGWETREMAEGGRKHWCPRHADAAPPRLVEP